jgi:ABC-2 type transport system ATP-binding protein
MNAIDLRDVTQTFRSGTAPEIHAVDGLSLRIGEGEVVAFLGPNGAGKTTTLDMVLGLTSPTSGSVQVLGQMPCAAVRKGLVAAVLQTGGLLRDITVRETVEVIAAQYATHLPVPEVMERAGITAIANRRVSKCSGGEQQRVRFALALLPDPRVIVLDEPTAGMDIGGRIEFWEAMRNERHRTVVFATHYLEEAQQFADRIVLINRGRLVADGTTHEIRSLTSIRTITCHDPQAVAEGTTTSLWRAIRSADSGARLRMDMVSQRLCIETANSDALLPVVLAAGGSDIEVAAPSLEAAFLALTGENESAGECRRPGPATGLITQEDHS